MNRLQLAIKGESRWLFFLIFLAICQVVITFSGIYTVAFASISVGVVGYVLYRMWRKECNEFNPRMAFREFSLQSAIIKNQSKTMGDAPSEIMSIFSQKAA